jgi:hypothetical protein
VRARVEIPLGDGAGRFGLTASEPLGFGEQIGLIFFQSDHPLQAQDLGGGVICETWALPAAVIPAKAGIYSANLRKCAVDRLDSRFRGNDRRFERDPIPNDTTTSIAVY